MKIEITWIDVLIMLLRMLKEHVIKFWNLLLQAPEQKNLRGFKKKRTNNFNFWSADTVALTSWSVEAHKFGKEYGPQSNFWECYRHHISFAFKLLHWLHYLDNIYLIWKRSWFCYQWTFLFEVQNISVKIYLIFRISLRFFSLRL